MCLSSFFRRLGLSQPAALGGGPWRHRRGRSRRAAEGAQATADVRQCRQRRLHGCDATSGCADAVRAEMRNGLSKSRNFHVKIKARKNRNLLVHWMVRSSTFLISCTCSFGRGNCHNSSDHHSRSDSGCNANNRTPSNRYNSINRSASDSSNDKSCSQSKINISHARFYLKTRHQVSE